MKKFLILCVVLIACEGNVKEDQCVELAEYPQFNLYIDSKCNDFYIDPILDAVETLNTMVCEPIVTVLGEKNISHDEPNRYQQTVACYDEEPYWWEGGYKGEASERDQYIDLFFFSEAFTQDYVKSLMLHELFHYIGVHGHLQNEEAIMHTAEPWKTEYSESDIDHFCEFFDCIN